MSDPLWPHEPQHTRPPCPSPTPRVYSNSCPLSQWCHPTISSSLVPFSSCLIIPSIRVFSNESALRLRWPKYWSFSFNISTSSEHPGLISFHEGPQVGKRGQVVMKAKLFNGEFGSPGKGTRSHEPSGWKRVTQTLWTPTRMCWISFNNCYCFIWVGPQLWIVSVSLRLAWQLKAHLSQK